MSKFCAGNMEAAVGELTFPALQPPCHALALTTGYDPPVAAVVHGPAGLVDLVWKSSNPDKDAFISEVHGLVTEAFNTLNEMSSFAEAALRLGEKPFKGGGMK